MLLKNKIDEKGNIKFKTLTYISNLDVFIDKLELKFDDQLINALFSFYIPIIKQKQIDHKGKTQRLYNFNMLEKKIRSCSLNKE